MAFGRCQTAPRIRVGFGNRHGPFRIRGRCQAIRGHGHFGGRLIWVQAGPDVAVGQDFLVADDQGLPLVGLQLVEGLDHHADDAVVQGVHLAAEAQAEHAVAEIEQLGALVAGDRGATRADLGQVDAGLFKVHKLAAIASELMGLDSDTGVPQKVVDSLAQHEVAEALFRAYFIEGANLTDTKVLADYAGEAGLPRDEILAYLDSDADVNVISAADAEARQVGIGGVPFFIFNRKVGVSGAQEPDALVQAMQQALGSD